MSNPFYDWRNPARPAMWSKDYFKLEHVQRLNEIIAQYNDGLLTTAELAYGVYNQYAIGYTAGLEDANYPVPAILPKHTKLVNLGYVSAENGFAIEAVFNQYIRI